MNAKQVSSEAFFWTLQALCAIHRKPFSLELAQKQSTAPYTTDALAKTVQDYGLHAVVRKCKAEKLLKETLPAVIWLKAQTPAPTATDSPEHEQERIEPALLIQTDDERALIIEPGDAAPRAIPTSDLRMRYLGCVMRIQAQEDPANDPDSKAFTRQHRRFGFAWFAQELLKHKRIWHEVLLASLVIQLIALATPLFTQVVIDKVVVHHTQSTLLVVAAGMALFMLFSAALSWLRQYLVLHTGNRVDAALGSSVVEHLFKLPPAYFLHRPTGIIAARLQSVETIREFIASAAITLALDLPFLLIFVAIMFYYNTMLTLIVLTIVGAIAGLSLLVAPWFQSSLQTQFQLGARNQAFLTEYLVGLETVKSLQLEPQLNSRYSSYLASYLQAAFSTRQLANSYNTIANLLEQVMNLLVLTIGAYTVMHSRDFTIGMLIAFQMFAGRLSQPMLRLTGLWQQFQQARLSVARLGDLMNAPAEPYSVVPTRAASRRGEIRIHDIAFRYDEHSPWLYENLSLTIQPGQAVAIMGPSGCGKSTLARLLQGFYQPATGHILIDGIDIRHLPANALRNHFGVVPQETILFSGTILDNLQMADPNATFEQIVAACSMAEIHRVIEALPKGYQTEIGERGAGLSGGQRQRIAIARALLKRPDILIFDEATSALDGPTAEQFARTINSLKGKVTMLFIAHGLPRSLRLDAIFRLTPNGAQIVVSRFPANMPATGTDGSGSSRPASSGDKE